MEGIAVIFGGLVWLYLQLVNVVISCAIGFHVFGPEHRGRQLLLGGFMYLAIILLGMEVHALLPRLLYLLLVMAACVLLFLRLLDTTDAMLFNLIRGCLLVLCAVFFLLHATALVLALVIQAI